MKKFMPMIFLIHADLFFISCRCFSEIMPNNFQGAPDVFSKVGEQTFLLSIKIVTFEI